MAISKTDFIKLVEVKRLGILYPRLFDHVTQTYEAEPELTDRTYVPDIQLFNPNVRQGIARDENYWYGFDTDKIYKFDLTGTQVVSNLTPFASLSNSATANHVSDGAVYDGKVYVPVANWTGTESLDVVVAVYDANDLSYITDYPVTSNSQIGSSLCINSTGTEMYIIGFDVAGVDRIEVYNTVDGTYNRTIKLSGKIYEAQGISIVDDYVFHITYDSISSGGVLTVRLLSDTFAAVHDKYVYTGQSHSGEIEGCTVYGGIFYAISWQGNILQYNIDTDALHIDNFSGAPQLLAPVPDSASIVMRLSPQFFNYNSIFDGGDTYTNDWESWVYTTGDLAWRLNSGTKITATLPSAGTEYIIGYTWNKIGTTVDINLAVDGIYGTAINQTWVAQPDALYLSAKNTANDDTDNIFRGYAVFNRVLTAQEMADLNSDFDSMYSLGWAKDPARLKPVNDSIYDKTNALSSAVEVYATPEAGFYGTAPNLEASGSQRSMFWLDTVPVFHQSATEGLVWYLPTDKGIGISPSDLSGAQTYNQNIQTFFARIKLLSRDADGKNVLYDYRSDTNASAPVFHAENSNVTDGVAYYNGGNGTDTQLSNANVLPLDTWVTIGISVNNGYIEIFADGALVGSGTIDVALNASDQDWIPFFTKYVYATSVDYNDCEVAWMAFHPSRACTTQEGIDLTSNPYQLLTLAIPSNEQIIIIGQASETNTAQAISKQKTKQIEQAAETDTAFSLSSSIILNILQAVENDTAQSASKLKTVALAQVQESNIAQPATTEKLKSVSQAQEADTANTLTKLKLKQIGQASETDMANSVATGTAIAINQASEINTAQTASHIKVKSISPAVENDIARSITSGNTVTIGYAQEAAAAQTVTKLTVKQVGQATETDAALVLLYPKIIQIVQAGEAEIALPVSIAGQNITIHPGRIYVVDAENRIFKVEPEDRIFKV